jgi:hypothetical protein
MPDHAKIPIAAIERWVSRFAVTITLGAMLVFVAITVTHLPAWMMPPHYPPLSPAHKSPFSTPGLTFVPIEGWAALAVAAVALTVRGAIAHYWPGLSGDETTN